MIYYFWQQFFELTYYASYSRVIRILFNDNNCKLYF